MNQHQRSISTTPFDAVAISYTLLRHLDLMLDELSSQGLEVWQDGRHSWHWRWRGTTFRSKRGFWALGEAIVDAVVARYPGAFDSQGLDEGEG